MKTKLRSGSTGHTHAGGIVYWSRYDTILYLLVRPKNNKDEWVFPKGHIESGEDDSQTALREVREETGVVARLVCPIRIVEFETDKETVRARFFLMERVSQGESNETREIEWTPYEEALELLTHHESKELLQAAESSRLTSSASRQAK